MDWGLEMITINRFGFGVVIAGVSVASIAGCRRDPSTASRSAAAYDEAQRQGVPLAEGGGHDHQASKPPAAGSAAGVADASAHAGHDMAVPTRAHHEGGESPRDQRRAGEMDHAAMGHEQAAPVEGQAGGHAGHAGMEATTRPPGAPPTSVSHEGHEASAGASGGLLDHAAMGHASVPAPAPSPEAASATATPGEPAATLRPDSLDGPAPTSVQEAARSGAMAAAGHAMSHGTYRQVDAGRDGVRPAPPGAPDPHAGHGLPAPRPSPSPKENR
jgi:hypothetical protein